MPSVPRPRNLIPMTPRVQPDPALNVITPRLERAGRTPQLDTTAAIQPALGAAKIGEGLQKAGGAVLALAERVIENQTITAEFKQAEMSEAARNDIAAAVASEPDYSRWTGIAEGRLGELEKSLADLPNVPGQARPVIDHKFQMFKTDIMGGLKVHAVKQSEADAVQAGLDVVRLSGRRGDMATGMTTIQGLVETKRITKERGDLLADGLKEDVEKKHADDQLEMVRGMARINPQATIEGIESGAITKGWSEETIDRGLEIARFQKRLGASKASTDLINRMLLPPVNPDGSVNKDAITTDAQIDDYAKDNPNFTPQMAQTAKNWLAVQSKSSLKQYYIDNADKLASRYYTMAMQFDPAKNSREEYFALLQQINHLPANMRDAATLLEQKMTGQPITPAKPMYALGESIMDDWLKQGLFGAYDNNFQVWDTKNNRPAVDSRGNPVLDYKRDHKAYAAALGSKSRLGGLFINWLNMNPKATEADVRTWLWEHQDDSTLPGTMGMLQGAVNTMLKGATLFAPAGLPATGQAIPGKPAGKTGRIPPLPQGDPSPVEPGLFFPGPEYIDDDGTEAGGEPILGFQ